MFNPSCSETLLWDRSAANDAGAAAGGPRQTRAPADRERTVPIPETLTPVPGYPQKLVVFKMAASRFWQVRCWVDGRTVRRSTKTQSLRMAQSFARRFYEQLMAQRYEGQGELDLGLERRRRPFDGPRGNGEKGANGIKGGERSKESERDKGASERDTQTSDRHVVTGDALLPKTQSTDEAQPPTTFGALAAQVLLSEKARTRRGEYSLGSWQVLKNRLDAHLLPRWGEHAPAAINYLALVDFTQSLSERFSSTTVSQYLVAVRKVLLYAVATGVLDKLPEFPRVKIRTTSRGAFTPSEYWKIIRCARRLRGAPHPDTTQEIRSNYKIRLAEQTMPQDLAWAIGFMLNSFIRPSDLKILKHRHVEIVRAQHTYLRLTLPETKSHGKPIVTLRPAVRIYEQINKHQQPLGQAGADDYLFLPQLKDRNYAHWVLNFHFNWVLAQTGLKQGPHGQSRSLYSLRHSSITFRLLYGQGIDLLTLARNARTSVDVINKHYASTVTGEQNIALLQSRRRVEPRSGT